MNLNPILKSSIACEYKTNIGGFQVQNVIFLDFPTMIALDFLEKALNEVTFQYDMSSTN
jgi:hypothetical protein